MEQLELPYNDGEKVNWDKYFRRPLTVSANGNTMIQITYDTDTILT